LQGARHQGVAGTVINYSVRGTLWVEIWRGKGAARLTFMLHRRHTCFSTARAPSPRSFTAHGGNPPREFDNPPGLQPARELRRGHAERDGLRRGAAAAGRRAPDTPPNIAPTAPKPPNSHQSLLLTPSHHSYLRHRSPPWHRSPPPTRTNHTPRGPVPRCGVPSSRSWRAYGARSAR